MRTGWGLRIGILAAALGGAVAPAQNAKAPPYWASLAAGDALMRSGPGRQYPAVWRYRRVDLPVRVVAVHESWRKVEDMEGTTGWFASVLLRDTRTGVVTGGVRPLREAPDPGARVLWRAEPGVIGRLERCGGGWCHFSVRGRGGFIEAAHFWGLNPGETLD